MLKFRFAGLGASPALNAEASARAVRAATDSSTGGLRLASFVEPVVSYGLVILFVVLLYSASVSPVSDFNWVFFIDHDDSYQVEQLLLNSGRDSFGRKAAYGSELFLLAPVYGLTALVADSPLVAYRFLKAVHILAAGASLLLLRAIIRRLGAPPFVAVLAIGLIVSSASVFTYALHLKPDANIVLFLLAASFLTLLKFDGTGGRGWLGASIALAALAAAVKWWGVFMLVPQVYLIASGGRIGGNFRPYIGWRGLAAVNAATIAVLMAVTVVQARLTVDAYPHTAAKATVVAIVGIVLLGVGLALLTGAGRLLLRRSDVHSTGPLPMVSKVSRLGYRVLSVGSLFTAGYVVLVGVYLLSDQLRPSITYFSNYGQAQAVGGGSPSSAIAAVASNVSGWVTSMYRFGVLPLLLLPLLAASVFLILKVWGGDQNMRRSRAVALFLLAILGFLFVAVARKNEATQAMLFPFLVVTALAPVAAWAATLPPLRRNLALTVVAALALAQIGWQSVRVAEVFGSYRGAAQAVHTINDDLDRQLPDEAISSGHPRLLVLERQFPISSQVGGVVHLRQRQYEQELDRLARSCSAKPDGDLPASLSGPDTILILGQGSLSRSESQRQFLLDSGCLQTISRITGQSFRRGRSFQYAFELYRIVKL